MQVLETFEQLPSVVSYDWLLELSELGQVLRQTSAASVGAERDAHPARDHHTNPSTNSMMI